MTLKTAPRRLTTLLAATVLAALPAALLPNPAHAGGGTVSTNGTICYEWQSQMNFGPYITLELSEPLPHEVTVYLTTVDGTAQAPHDYIPFTPPLKVVIPPRITLVQVRLRIVPDTLREPDEFFLVFITEVIGAEPGNTIAEVIIKDGPPPSDQLPGRR